MKIVTANNGKQTVKISRTEWTNIGKVAGWMDEYPEDKSGPTPEEEQSHYEGIYEVPVPADHKNGKLLKTYEVGRHAEIEKYSDGYFEIINLVHGKPTHYTKNWSEALTIAKEINSHYSSL